MILWRKTIMSNSWKEVKRMAIATVIGVGFIVTALPMLFDEPEKELVKLNYHKPDVKVETPDVSFAFEVEQNREQARRVLDGLEGIQSFIDTVEPECLPPLEYVGEFYITMYAATTEQCGNSLGITASGRKVTDDPTCHTVAVDPKVIPLGSYLIIEGYEGIIFRADDTGSAINGYDIDIFTTSESESKTFNNQSGVKVWIIKD
jgi:3D (Asp-Asp-Asp) domain-containing protein